MKPVHVTFENIMAEALRLAERGRGHVEPNPMVGAVIARQGEAGWEVVAGGFHPRLGGPHAEVVALDDAAGKGVDVRGLTMAVTLEPCSHHGKTPPCVDALIAAGLVRVVVAMQDPYHEVAGQGLAKLREAGIDVVLGVKEQDAQQLNEAYLKRVTTGIPWVIAKWAMTLDGKIATRTGHSQWISSEASRRHVHEWRGKVDAIVTGIGTVLADNPKLTARQVEVARHAQRVVIDPDGCLPADSHLGQARDVLVWRQSERELLEHLAAQGATNVLIEAGGGLVGKWLQLGLIDQILAFVAPRVLGDARALDPVRGMDIETIQQGQPLTLRNVERFGQDVLLDYRVTPSPR